MKTQLFILLVSCLLLQGNGFGFSHHNFISNYAYPHFWLGFESCIASKFISEEAVSDCIDTLFDNSVSDDIFYFSKGSGTKVIGKYALAETMKYFIQTIVNSEFHGNMRPFVCERDNGKYLSILDDVTTSNTTYASGEPELIEVRERKYLIWERDGLFNVKISGIVFGGRYMYSPLRGEIIEYIQYEVLDLNGCKVPELEYCFNDPSVC